MAGFRPLPTAQPVVAVIMRIEPRETVARR
jgi:hypothetical protein